MPIKNLSNIRRLPRLGKIHLGVKKVSEKSDKEYPSEVDYFVVPPAVEEIFGEKPKELRIMFPVENEEVFFQQWYKRYGYNLLRCKGDGERAMTWDEEKGGMKTIDCPCDELKTGGNCRRVAILQFMLPEVPGAGVWQISTSSRNSIIDLNSSIVYIRGLCGRIRMIPLVLKREPIDITRIENGQPKSGRHYTMKIDLGANISVRDLQLAAQVEPEAVMISAPDEAQDDLLYPVGGFKPEKEIEAKVESSEKTQERTEGESPMLAAYKMELNYILTNYRKLGGEVSNKEDEELDILETVEEYEKAIKYWKPKFTKLHNAESKKEEEKENVKLSKEKVEMPGTKKKKSSKASPPDNLFEGQKV